MAMPAYIILRDRGVIRLTGGDVHPFLQGLISNDIDKVGPTQAIHAALLTAQGKFLHDFFIATHGDGLLLDCEKDRRDDLIRRLTMYKLRADVTIMDCSDDYAVAAIYDDGAVDVCGLPKQAGVKTSFHDGIAYVDPRHQGMGVRSILPAATANKTLQSLDIPKGTEDAFNIHRITLGLPDGSHDMVVEKAILLENGFDELHGVDWEKGCYVGQELTARTKHRGLIKKRLLPVTIDGEAPAPGTALRYEEKEAGEMRTSVNGKGLALIRLDYLTQSQETGIPIKAGNSVVTPQKPDWAEF